MGPSRNQQNSPPHRVANLCVRALTQEPQIAEQQITENPDLRMHCGSTVVTGSDRRKKSNLGEN